MWDNKAYQLNTLIFENNEFFNIVEVLNKYCEYHHTAYSMGYVKVKDLCINRYNGRFGVGFTLHQHAGETSYYHHMTYYIFRSNNQLKEFCSELVKKLNESED